MEPSAVGFDLGDTLCEYAGVPLSWEREYPAALAAVANQCGHELTPERLQSGTRVLLRYNTRRTPRRNEREYGAEDVFRELLEKWGSSPDSLAGSIAAFFSHFRQTLRAFPESAVVLAKLHQLGVPTGVLTDVPYGMPRNLILSDLEQTGLPIPDERLVTSTMVGHRKPHPAGIRALAQELGVSCDRLLYVGNELKDVDGGNGAGLPDRFVVALARRSARLGSDLYHSIPRTAFPTASGVQMGRVKLGTLWPNAAQPIRPLQTDGRVGRCAPSCARR